METITINSSHVERLSHLNSFIIKNYLYKLFIAAQTSENIKVNKVLGINNLGDVYSFAETANCSFKSQNDQYSFRDCFLLFSVEYEKVKYEISVKRLIQIDHRNRDIEENILCISGTTNESDRTSELFELINKNAIANFTFKRKVIKYNRSEETYFIDHLSVIEQLPINIHNIFLPSDKINQINRFIMTASNYSEHNISLRYLFNGPPGTGKTMLMNSVINSLKGKATIMICNGADIELNKIFEFCSLFTPCVLIIDDIDFLAGNRDDNNTDQTKLAYLLQALDGFIPNNIFMLAATNDKKLVDAAAARPGRFDLILDIGEIDADNYISLIKRETDDHSIIELFNRQILNKLEDKKVSGAFIVNLVKQLKTIRISGEDINSEKFTDLFNLLYKGFYDFNNSSFNKSMGFLK